MTDGHDIPGFHLLHRSPVDGRVVALSMIVADSFGRVLPDKPWNRSRDRADWSKTGLRDALSASFPSW